MRSSDLLCGNASALNTKNKHFIGSFVRYKGEYHAIGMSSWTTRHEKIYLEYCDERMQNAHAENLKGQYESYVKKKRGQRIFFFDNFKEYLDWQKRDFKIKDIEALATDDDERKDAPLMAFLEPNGGCTLVSDIQSIRSRLNIYYEEKDAALNHNKGKEYGRKLLQQNAEFFARCFRRDIK